MSLITWMEEYCPESAQDCVERGATDIELVEHGLRKWRGLSYGNLVRHQLVEDKNGDLVDGDSGERMLIDWSTCALCLVYLHDDRCATCPLAIVRGGISCDEKVDGEELSPYGQWVEWLDPDSMIRLLEKAKKWLTAKAKAGSRRP